MTAPKKFPKAFRILAGIQVIFAVALVTLVAAGFKDPKSIALLGVFEYPFLIFSAIWSLFNVILWFFGFKGSYHFLYSSGLNFLLICITTVRFSLRQQKTFSLDEGLIVGAIIGGAFMLYGLTLIFSLFRKKLRDWTSAVFSWQHLGMYLLILLIAGLSTPHFHKLYKYNSWRGEILLQYDYFLDLGNAIERNNKRAIGAALRSGRYDPNLLFEDGQMPLFEYLMRNYDSRNWGERIAKNPDLSVTTKVTILKNIFRDLTSYGTQDWYVKNGGKKIQFSYHSKPIFDMIKTIPEDWTNGMKFNMDETSYIIESENIVMLVRDGRWGVLHPNSRAELLKIPTYSDLIETIDGKELILYIRRRTEDGYQRFVEVYNDPFEGLNSKIDWNSKLLFSAVYDGSYIFDGSLEFPEDLRILSSKLDIAADYGKYLSWVENNLSDFAKEPVTIPIQYRGFLDGQTHLIPVAIQKEIDERFDMILFRWQGDFDGQVVSFNYDAIVYENQEITAHEEILRKGFYESPKDRFSSSIEGNRVKVHRKAYTKSIMGEVIEETAYPDSTYYFSVSEEGELIPPGYLLPAVAGTYDYGRLFLSINGDYISGYYNNGQYQGNPNFGCSFLFSGRRSDLVHKRKINITILNPYQLSQPPKQGTLALHSEDDDLLTIQLREPGATAGIRT